MIGRIYVRSTAMRPNNNIHRQKYQRIRQELIRRWDSERELLYDDNIHVEASAYAHWADLLISTTPCLKNVPALACDNFDAREWIWIFFGRNVTDKVGNQKTLYYATSNNLCFCTTWQNAETRKSHTSLNWIVLHTQCTCVLSSWKKKLSSAMCLIASNICWGSKISHEYCSLTFTPALTKNNSHLLHSDWQRDWLG